MADNNYKSFDVCLNILYDKVYNKEPENCYVVPPIIKSDIEVDMLKRTDPENWEKIWDAKFKYMGYYNGKWTFKRISTTSYPCTVSIGEYNPSNANLNDLRRSELINMAMHYILSEIVISERVKYILLPIANFDITFGQLKQFSSDVANNLGDFADNANLYVNVTEQYFDMYTLNEFFEENIKKLNIREWKVLFFQVLYTLSKISERLRKFRHNMLNLDAIRVYITKNNNSVDRYRVGDKLFEIPNVGFEIRITDFEKSYTADYIRNKDTNLVSDNPYYDVNYFFQSIIYLIQKNNVLHTELNQFLLDMVPENLRIPNENEFAGLDERLFDAIATTVETPAIILRKNNFFSEFIKESIDNMDLSASPINNNSENINKFTYKESGIEYNEISLTDNSSDEPRLLARNINFNKNNQSKKKTSYNSRMNKSIIHGSRKMNVPRLGQTDTFSEGAVSDRDLFDKIEKDYNRSRENDSTLQKRSKDKTKDNRTDQMRERHEGNNYEDEYYEAFGDIVEPSETSDDNMMSREQNNTKNRQSRGKKEEPEKLLARALSRGRIPESNAANSLGKSKTQERSTDKSNSSELSTSERSNKQNRDNRNSKSKNRSKGTKGQSRTETSPDDFGQERVNLSDTSEDIEDEEDIDKMSRQNSFMNSRMVAQMPQSQMGQTGQMGYMSQIGKVPDMNDKIIQSLPEGYTGELPEHLKRMLMLPDASKFYGFNNNMFKTLNGMGQAPFGNIAGLNGTGGMGSMGTGFDMGQLSQMKNLGSAVIPPMPNLEQPQLQIPTSQTIGTGLPPDIPMLQVKPGLTNTMPQLPSMSLGPNPSQIPFSGKVATFDASMPAQMQGVSMTEMPTMSMPAMSMPTMSMPTMSMPTMQGMSGMSSQNILTIQGIPGLGMPIPGNQMQSLMQFGGDKPIKKYKFKTDKSENFFF